MGRDLADRETPPMLYDLCVDGHAGSLTLRGLLAEAVVLGYDVVALERRAHKLGDALRCVRTLACGVQSRILPPD